MSPAKYFYMTTLPALGDLGSPPPIGLGDLIEHVEGCPSWREQLAVLVLFDDLEQREAFLVGETDQVEPAVLSLQQAKGEAPLPEPLTLSVSGAEPIGLAADLHWARYFRYANRSVRSNNGRFLKKWTQFEVALRNALASARAVRLGLQETCYLVAPEIASAEDDFTLAVSAWEAAQSPLDGLRALIRFRWAWLEQNDHWFSFSVDELLAYAARLMLLAAWMRTEENIESHA